MAWRHKIDLPSNPGSTSLQEQKLRKVINGMIREELSESDLSKYESMSDYELKQWAEDNGMEELIVPDLEGGLANRDEIIQALLGLDTPNTDKFGRWIDKDQSPEYPDIDKDPAGGSGLRSHLEESLQMQKLRKVIRESVEKVLSSINKEAESEVLNLKLEKIQAAIEKRNNQLSKLDEDEDMKALTDKKKLKQLQKDVKALEKAKAKIEKQLSKVNKKNKGVSIPEKEIIDEDGLDEDNITEGPKADSAEEIKASWEDIKKIMDDVEGMELFEENEDEELKYKIKNTIKNNHPNMPEEAIDSFIKMHLQDIKNNEDIMGEFTDFLTVNYDI